MATRAEQLTELQAERAQIKSALANARNGMSSFSIDGQSVSYSSTSDLRADLITVEKSIQRLKRGGRGIVVDMSYGTGAGVDPYRSGDEVLL